MAWGLTKMVMESIRGGRGKGVSRAKELKHRRGEARRKKGEEGGRLVADKSCD